jgi:hypothetical protein
MPAVAASTLDSGDNDRWCVLAIPAVAASTLGGGGNSRWRHSLSVAVTGKTMLRYSAFSYLVGGHAHLHTYIHTYMHACISHDVNPLGPAVAGSSQSARPQADFSLASEIAA